MITLSILIPTLHKRRGLLSSLLKELNKQVTDEVEILTFPDDGRISTGNKRNKLIQDAKGKYTVFIDDDDAVTPDYIPLILKAAEKNPDVITFNGWMTVDGVNRKDFYFGIDYPYTLAQKNGKDVYLRYPNHLCPIRREIAASVPFPNKTLGEDYEWATKLHDMKLLKTEENISKHIYHYVYRSFK
jgi:glycosyltransferase involved in cell wall biosynthesis